MQYLFYFNMTWGQIYKQQFVIVDVQLWGIMHLCAFIQIYYVWH